MSAPPSLAYKVLTREQMEQFVKAGQFTGAPVDLKDGFIHLSTKEQLRSTIEKHFAGQSALFIALVDLEMLGDRVRWEKARGGQLFPHVYGALPMNAVTSIFSRDGDADDLSI